MYLEQIKNPNDIKNIAESDYPLLAEEIRQFLISSISKTGGHLAPNLGVVELTMALHLELDLPKDKIIWDVGHQSYTHKLLTGRMAEFDSLRQYHGMSGFPKRHESECDAFNTGHSSTSVSAGLGMVKARELNGTDETIVSVIGDGSLTGGMAYEALNNAGKQDANFIIILNDNNMSISENVGGVPKYLNQIRTSANYLDLKETVYNRLKESKHGDSVVERVRRAKNGFKSLMMPGMLFEQMGIVYLGPIDGHDVNAMRIALREAKRFKRSVMIHVITEKGRGYGPAQRHPARFHGTGPFDIETGIPAQKQSKANWTDIFSTVMLKLGERNPDVVAITAAMAEHTGLKRFGIKYPDRLVDVGIAEEHAVTFAAGLAVGGKIPVVAIYSSFLQRAYDQILHDVCMQSLPVVFAIDRGGLVGADGETHQGVFDLSFLATIPNLAILAPKNKWELSDMLKFAVDFGGPIAIRYPRGAAYDGLVSFRAPIEYGRSEWIYRGDEVALVAVGSMVETAERVCKLLKERGVSATVINARFVKPLDTQMLNEVAQTHKLIVTMEENVCSGGFGERTLDYLNSQITEAQLLNISIPDRFVEHGSITELKEELGLLPEQISERIMQKLYDDIKKDSI